MLTNINALLTEKLGPLGPVMVLLGLAVVLWNAYRQRQKGLAASRESGQHLDVGETVQVEAWDAQGLAQVKHRGAIWTAMAASADAPPAPGLFRIQAIQGNRLVLEKI